MKIYLAAKYKNRDAMLVVAGMLAAQGHQITSRWLTGAHKFANGDVEDREKAHKFAATDLDDVRNSDYFVLFNLPVDKPEPSSGRHVELGYAFALKKEVYIVGGINSHCIFYALADKIFESVEALLHFTATDTGL